MTSFMARAHLAATSIGNLAIFAGGNALPDRSAVVDIYDVSTGDWSVATLSEARSNLSAVSVLDRALFAGGDIGSFTESDRIDVFSPPLGTVYCDGRF